MVRNTRERGSVFTAMRPPLDPEALALPFDRLDAGDVTELREVDVLIDLPGVISVVRIHFRSGVGYEVLFTPAGESDDFRDVVAIVGTYQLVRFQEWGENDFGFPLYRALYWDHLNRR